MTPERIAQLHVDVMDELVPSIRKGMSRTDLYVYYVRFARAHKMLDESAEGLSKFLSFVRHCASASSDPFFWENKHFPEPLFPDALSQYAQELVANKQGFKSETAVSQVKEMIKGAKRPALEAEADIFLADAMEAVLVASATSIQKYYRSLHDEPIGPEDDPAGLDGWEIADADLKGLITGMAAGFAVGVGSGGSLAPAAGVGAAVGTLVASSIEYLEQDAVDDAKGVCGVATVDSSGGNGSGSVWTGGGQGGSDWPAGWHDGDGYGLG